MKIKNENNNPKFEEGGRGIYANVGQGERGLYANNNNPFYKHMKTHGTVPTTKMVRSMKSNTGLACGSKHAVAFLQEIMTKEGFFIQILQSLDFSKFNLL